MKCDVYDKMKHVVRINFCRNNYASKFKFVLVLKFMFPAQQCKTFWHIHEIITRNCRLYYLKDLNIKKYLSFPCKWDKTSVKIDCCLLTIFLDCQSWKSAKNANFATFWQDPLHNIWKCHSISCYMNQNSSKSYPFMN